MKKPELLAPAGNLEKLKTAFLFGADAVYVGNPVFGLRKYADNFSLAELQAGFAFAKAKQKKVYIVLNGFAQEQDLDPIKQFIFTLKNQAQQTGLKPDAFIIADIGVLNLAKSCWDIPLHLSTQASNCNQAACKFYETLGVSRMILGRETSLAECQAIQQDFTGELEIFVHGAMCASYSGRCVISNYTSGRDSNRGGCIQSCRHSYSIRKDQDTNSPASYQANIMNAKDLWGIDQLKNCFELNIASLKIEGRMKSNMYLANCVATYRKAIDEIAQTGLLKETETYKKQLAQVSNRDFSDNNISSKLDASSVNAQFNGYNKGQDFIGIVRACQEQKGLIIEVKAPLSNTDILQLQSQNSPQRIKLEPLKLYNLAHSPINSANPNQSIHIAWQDQFKNTQALDLLYRPLSSTLSK
eukprot:COSAG01_NODE_128_length_24936_cov_324.347264_3_plen_413_part_00